jgi:uncharacterized membrane protein HdeD (DUF308 family)
MSKVGIGGTIFSIFCGFVFIASGIFLIIYRFRFQEIGVPEELCIPSAILISGYGLVMVLVGRDQIKGIKEGKEYPSPSSGILP